MTKKIETLIEDVNDVLLNGADITDEWLDRTTLNFRNMLKNRLSKESKKNTPKLRMSNIGSPCFRKTYLQVNYPEAVEPLRAPDILKFLYGDLIEELMIGLADLAGHSVAGRQDTQSIAGVEGHRDVVMDGTTVDVKSTSSYSYTKFKDNKLEEDDPFGYKVQLQSYIHAGKDDPVVTDKNRGAFWAIDKVTGNHCLLFQDKKEWDMESAYKERVEQIGSDKWPERSFEPKPDGKSGNMALDTFCSYCNVKKECYKGTVRTFLSSKGPLYLTKVEREPRMPELLDDGTVKVLDG